jgi:hypothetical protein
VNDDVLFAGVLDPDVYDVVVDVDAAGCPVAVLVSARVLISDELAADPDTVVLTDTVPFGTPTVVATSIIDEDLNGPVPFEFGALFAQFSVDFDTDGSVTGCPAGSVCWEFDITITTESEPSGVLSTVTTQLIGVQSGTLSGDTITWNTIEGTRTITSTLGDSDPEQTVEALEDVFNGVSLGTWTLIPQPG